MKKLINFFAFIIAITASSQVPQGFNYQATVRNASGDLIVNQNVYFKFNILQGSQTATPTYTEIHYVPTDDAGQVSLVIGKGTASTGVFSDLDWSLGDYFLGIELDTDNGYVAMGTTQFYSVPYALYAESSGNGSQGIPTLESVLQQNNSASSQQIKDLNDPTDGQDAVTKNYTESTFYTKAQVDDLIINIQSQINALHNPVPLNSISYGTQYWTVENANMETYRDGTPIPQVLGATDWKNRTTGAWCYFENDPTKHKLYNWYAVVGIHDNSSDTPNKELAPEGWHVPTAAEWTTLENYLVGEGYNFDGTTTSPNKIAKAMGSAGGWNNSTREGDLGNDQSTNNSSGFNWSPDGHRFIDNNNSNYTRDYFFDGGNMYPLWIPSESSFVNGVVKNTSFDVNSIRQSAANKASGFQVRFVKD